MKKDDYSDLLDLPHPSFPNHPPMPMKERAAQFSSFSVLTGFDEELDQAKETVEEAYREIEKGEPVPEDEA